MSTLFEINMTEINKVSPLKHPYLQVSECIANVAKEWHYIGTLPSKRVPTVSIVGTRKPTSYGREVTELFAGELARRGVVIVSGLALGVDAIAHKAALAANGTTIAIQANGLHRIYPSSHRHLAGEIVEKGGAIISEYETGVEPMQYRFLERNRIVSGISDAVLITEAARRSGTLNTAAHALNQGKELFIIPGNITSPMSMGCNELIKQGAIPVSSPDEILEIIAPNLRNDNSTERPRPKGSNPLEDKIIELVYDGIKDGDELQKLTKASASELSVALTMLELTGVIRSLGANQWGYL